jgi:uncharacterized protein YbjT (DUF2867 family)
VRRLVLLSGRGEEGALETEQALTTAADAGGAEWTVVRSSFFAQNFSEEFMVEAVRAGEVALPVGDVPEPFIDVEDVADVAVAALTGDGHAGRVYEVTGPRLLSFADAVDEVAKAAGRPVTYRRIPVEAYTAELAGYGLPTELVDLLTYLFTEVMDGRNASLADGVRRALGREPRDFTAYARDAAATGVWDGELR